MEKFRSATMEENGALSPSMLGPLRMLTSGYHGGYSSLHRQLAVVAPTTTASSFHLPDGWEVENVPRPDGSQIDKYYYEPGTRLKFRSLKAVERYLTGAEYTASHKALKLGNHVRSSGTRKMVVSGGMLLRLEEDESNQLQLALVAPTISAATSPFVLPDGWIVEEVPRRCRGYKDKYYYEPGTGRQFRSLISVQRYLAEVGDNAPLSQVFELCKDNAPLSQVLKLCNRVKNSGSRKKISRDKVKTSTSDSDKPPAKINWVLADPGGCTWNPFTGESMVPEPVKQQWANRFMLSINDGNCAAPDFEW